MGWSGRLYLLCPHGMRFLHHWAAFVLEQMHVAEAEKEDQAYADNRIVLLTTLKERLSKYAALLTQLAIQKRLSSKEQKV